MVVTSKRDHTVLGSGTIKYAQAKRTPQFLPLPAVTRGGDEKQQLIALMQVVLRIVSSYYSPLSDRQGTGETTDESEQSLFGHPVLLCREDDEEFLAGTHKENISRQVINAQTIMY